MAYQAGDGFLPSWGPGMKPLEPHDPPHILDNALKPKSGELKPKSGEFGEMWKPTSGEGNARWGGELPLYGTTHGNVMHGNFPNGRVGDMEGSLGSKKSLWLLCLPSFVGIVTLVIWCFLLWRFTYFCEVVLGFFVLIGFLICLVGFQGGVPARSSTDHGYSTVFMKTLGGCTIFAAMLGCLLGLIGYFNFTRSYNLMNASHDYHLVSPTAVPAAYRDAGVITFTSDAHVDYYKAASYRMGITYCAAPIVGSGDPGNVGFWAVGKDCCKTKGSFNCGPIQDSSVHGGLVVFDANPEFEQENDFYIKAAEESAARAGLVMPSNPIFIKWSSTVADEINAFSQNAATFVLCAALGILIFMLLLVVSCVYIKRNGISNGGLVDQFYSYGLEDVRQSVAPPSWQKQWHELQSHEVRHAQALGWNEETWRDVNKRGSPASSGKSWAELQQQERAAAGGFGWNERDWNATRTAAHRFSGYGEIISNKKPAVNRAMEKYGETIPLRQF